MIVTISSFEVASSVWITGIISTFIVIITRNGGVVTSDSRVTGITRARVLKAGDRIMYATSIRATVIESTFVIIITILRNIFVDTSIGRVTIVFSTSIVIITIYATIFTTNLRITTVNSTSIIIVAIYSLIFTTSIRVASINGTSISVVTGN